MNQNEASQNGGRVTSHEDIRLNQSSYTYEYIVCNSYANYEVLNFC